MMNRRKFLGGLFGSAVALSAGPLLVEEVSRVYSFPTNIFLPQVDLVTKVFIYSQTYALNDVMGTYYNKRFIDNLKSNMRLGAALKRYSLPDVNGQRHELLPSCDLYDLSSDFED